MKKQFLIEELNKIHRVMGLNPLLVEAAFPGLSNVVRFIESFIDNAASVGRVIRGDAAEINAATTLLKGSARIEDQLMALARLAKASDELAEEILPLIQNLILRLPGGDTALRYMDDFITNAAGQGISKSQVKTAIDGYIDNTFGSQPKGLKDMLKQKYSKKIESASPSGGSLVQTFDSIEDEISGLFSNLNNVPVNDEEFINKMNVLLKKYRLPNVTSKQVEEIVRNSVSILDKQVGGKFSNLFKKNEDIMTAVSKMTNTQQKKFFQELSKEIHANPGQFEKIGRYFNPFNNPEWKLNPVGTWKDSVAMAKYAFFAGLVVDIFRALLQEGEFKGHLGMDKLQTIATKVAALFFPYINIYASAILLADSIRLAYKGEGKKEPKNDDMMQFPSGGTAPGN
jgi:hypothetical protein